MSRNGKRGRDSWADAVKRAAQGKPPKWMVAETAFDAMLREAGIQPEKAHEFLMVRQWVKKHHARKYVPETVLVALGIQPDRVWYSEARG